MPCDPFEIKHPDGTVSRGFVCSRGRRRRGKCEDCGQAVDADAVLCDWKLTGDNAGKTCSRASCLRCRTNVGPNKDLCRVHAAMWAKHPANPRKAP